MVSRFSFVQDFRDTFGVKRLCRVLGLSWSGFHAWKKRARARAERAARDAELTVRIAAIHEADPANGSPRITPPSCASRATTSTTSVSNA